MLEEFLVIPVVGALMSFLIQSIKNKFGDTSMSTKILTVVLSIVVGAGYSFARNTVYWTTILTVLGSASTVYALFLKPSA